MISELQPFLDGDPFIELIYHLPTSNAFKTVNGAVHYTLAQFYPFQQVPRDESEGSVIYPLIGRGVAAQLAVLYVADCVAALRLRPILPPDPNERIAWLEHNGPLYRAQFVPIIRQCHAAIGVLLRRAATIENTKPQAPPRTDLDALFIWQEIYYPDMRDKELAEVAGIEYQSIRNARKKRQRPKRPTRALSQKK